MPVDNKRINAPEDTVPYQLFERKTFVPPEQTFKELLRKTETGQTVRLDGRNNLEHRKIFAKVGIVSQAKGSAYVEVGDTKVIVSVFDPREIPNKNDFSLKGELYCEFKYAPFSCPRRRGFQAEPDEKQNAAILKKALEAAVCRHEFPNFQVDIYALVLQNDGSCVSAAVNCTGLALAHAGIPMYDLITSVTLGVQGDKMFLDPTLKEEEICGASVPGLEDHGVVLMSALHTHAQVSEFYQTGSVNLEALLEVMDVLAKSTRELKPLVENCLVKYIYKHYKRNVV